MTEWISTKDQIMPKDREILGLFKNRKWLLQFDEDNLQWHGAWGPGEANLSNTKLNNESISRFTHWAELPKSPYD